MAHLKLLCLCQGGNSRSVALAYLLKFRYGHDALACGWQGNDPPTRNLLYRWADRIFVLQSIFLQYVPKRYRKKVTIYDVGPDVWCNGLHPELLEKCDQLIRQDAKWLDFE